MRSTACILSFCLCLASSASAAAQAAQDAERPPPGPGAAKTAPAAKAQKNKPADRRKLEDWGADRVMGGHAFPFATFVDTPFAASYLGVTGGLEYHLVPHVSKPIAFLGNGGTERVDLQTLNVAETLDFELRLHELFAVFGSAYGRARVGVNAPTLLGNGGDYRYGGNVGALLRVLRIGSFQLALRGQVGYYAGQQAGILGLFRDLGNIVNDAIVGCKPTRRSTSRACSRW